MRKGTMPGSRRCTTAPRARKSSLPSATIPCMAVLRYVRLFMALTRFSLAGEMAFRANFLVKITVEVLWLGLLLIFYRTVFLKTSTVADWSEPQYLFFIGCYFALEGLIETLFLENCTEFGELVRTGDLDFI